MDPKELMKAFVDAHNSHDLERMLAHFTEDTVMMDPAAPIPLNSKADMRKLYEMIFSTVPDIHFEITGMISEGNRVFASFRTTGKGNGTFAGQDITGKPIDVKEAMFSLVENGKIKWTQFYSDTVTLTEQLGYQTAGQSKAK
ncbi:MAG: nuclear transport factor 2 family protein [Candidatus Binatia bacterium]